VATEQRVDDGPGRLGTRHRSSSRRIRSGAVVAGNDVLDGPAATAELAAWTPAWPWLYATMASGRSPGSRNCFGAGGGGFGRALWSRRWSRRRVTREYCFPVDRINCQRPAAPALEYAAALYVDSTRGRAASSMAPRAAGGFLRSSAAIREPSAGLHPPSLAIPAGRGYSRRPAASCQGRRASPQCRHFASLGTEVIGGDTVGQCMRMSLYLPRARSISAWPTLGSCLAGRLGDAYDVVNHAQAVAVVQDEVPDAVLGVDLLPERHVGSESDRLGSEDSADG